MNAVQPRPGADQIVEPSTDAWAIVRDVVRLVVTLARDPRVPAHAKLVAASSLAAVVPGVRRLLPRPRSLVWAEPLLLVAGVRYLITAAGYDLVRQAWPGDDAGFVWLLLLTGIDR